MALLDDLKRLARVPRSDAPFLSLYLNTCWDSEKQRERVRIFVKNRLRECQTAVGEGAEGFGEDAEKIEHYVKGLVGREWDEAFDGVAIFACSRHGVYEVVRSHLPFQEYFACTDRPILRPAVGYAQAGEPALLVLIRGDAGRLVELELGGVGRTFDFSGEEPPGRSDQGGWSQTRLQRHEEEQLQRNLRRVAGHLVKWADERRVRRIVLSGTEPLLSAFEEHLPKRLAPAVCARLQFDPSASPDGLHEKALAALGEARDRENRAAVEALLDRGLGTGRAVAGPGPVAEAVAQGRVHVLYLDGAFEVTGWKCFECGGLGLKFPLGCPSCGTAVEGVELGEELVRGVLAKDGAVVCLAGHGGLRAVGGTAAQLRYG
ncbi:MAG: baeRF10 domain-containing protein [Deferrisomatales bacterium]